MILLLLENLPIIDIHHPKSIYKLTNELPSFNNDVITNSPTTTPTIILLLWYQQQMPLNIDNISNTIKSNFAFAVRYTPSYILIVITSLWLIYLKNNHFI